jgi:hypothetical protein
MCIPGFINSIMSNDTHTHRQAWFLQDLRRNEFEAVGPQTLDSMTERKVDPVTVIPIHVNGDVPEWAMLELNGELLPPKDLSHSPVVDKENPVGETDTPIPNDCLELGAVRFVNNVRRLDPRLIR